MDTHVKTIDANLVTVCIESVLYGIFLVLFVASISLVVTRHRETARRARRNGMAAAKSVYLTPMFMASVALSLTVTAHWILTVDRLFLAFVHFHNGTKPLQFYLDLSQVTSITKIGLLVATILIGDAIIVYRLWIVWNYNRIVIIFPLCTLLGLAVCGIGIIYQFTQYIPGQNPFLTAASRWISSDCAFTLSTNVYCTAMIAWQILRSSSQSQNIGLGSLNSVLATLVESAAIITTQTLFFTIVYHLESNLQIIGITIWSPIAGIAFMLINVRVALGWAARSTTAYPSATTNPPSVLQYARPQGTETMNASSSYPMAMDLVKIDRDADDSATYAGSQIGHKSVPVRV
ncbi:hypothetical protein B0H10DRAFT_300702 [Mycena sp. CBHHK59/15]|nr:hypothetical protein B0H10DRAFT_300702 [Mycena sp. CBHHK59/15]